MQKIRKILRAVSEKTALPTNQPTNYYQQHQSYRTSLTPVQKIWLFEMLRETTNVKFCFFSKCDEIRRKLHIWSHLLKKSLMENFIFLQWYINFPVLNASLKILLLKSCLLMKQYNS